MSDAANTERVRELYQAHGAFYAGDPDNELRELLTEDVVLHVPAGMP